MRRTLSILLAVAFISTMFLTSCNEDTQGPKIYLLGADGNIIQDVDNDTVVLLFTKYVDPGVIVEDNASPSDLIVLENDSADALSLNTAGYLKRAEEVVITYTATDEAGNTSTKGRNIKIGNISDPFVNSYATTRDAQYINDTIYNSSVTADTKVPGRLKFPKVYAHYWNGNRSYFKVTADLYHENLSNSFSDDIAYMGTASDKDEAFYTGMTYEEGTDSILTFTRLKIEAQQYEDTSGNVVYIAGSIDSSEGHDLPLSRIEYLAGTKTITKIILELNVSRIINGVQQSPDQVIEYYVPQ